MHTYGSTNNNERGLELLDYLQTTDLMALKRGNHPTFHDATRTEVMDFTFASERLADKVVDWRVSSEVSTSAFDVGCLSSGPESSRSGDLL